MTKFDYIMKAIFKKLLSLQIKSNYILLNIIALSKKKVLKFYWIRRKVLFIQNMKLFCFLVKERSILRYYIFSMVIFLKIKIYNCFVIFEKIKTNKFNILNIYIYLKLFSSYIRQFVVCSFTIFKQLYKETVKYISTIQFHLLFKKFKNWLYEDVYKVLERYLFIYIFTKYKKSVQKKPKKMSVLYFYWLEYSILVYIGFFIIIFYIVYIFQFEIIFYYFPDVFVLRLNELMMEPQLSFSNTNSFLVDSYINP